MAAVPVGYWLLAAATVGAAAYTSDQSRKAQHRGQDQQRELMRKQEEKANRDYNAANKKQPNIEALMAANRAGGTGGGGALLNSPLQPGQLGSTTLLGQ